MLAVSMTVDVSGDRELFEGPSKRLRNPREFMRRVGEFAVSCAQQHLSEVLRDDPEAIRTGRLESSLSVFAVDEHEVIYGSNVDYAAQVHFGGLIEPRTAKALAIPLPAALKRAGLWPRDLDPQRELLQFVPYRGSKPNVFGLLVDPGQELSGRQRRQRGVTPYGPGPLYALAWWVDQEPRPYLYLDEGEQRVIAEEMWPQWLNEL